MFLRLETTIGTEFADCVSTAIRVAALLKLPVVFDANGVEVIVNANSTVEKVTASWNAALAMARPHKIATG